MSTTTTTTFNFSHYLYSASVAEYDRLTGEAIPRIVCSCGKSFVLWHSVVTPEEFIARHAEQSALLGR